MAAVPAPTTPTPAGSHYVTSEPKTPAALMNGMSPVDAQLRTGDVLVDSITVINELVEDVILLRQGYANLLANLTLAAGNLSAAGNLTAKYGTGNATTGVGTIVAGTGTAGTTTIQPLGGR